MKIDYSELERRVLTKLENAHDLPSDNDSMARIFKFLREEIVYVTIHTLVEYDKMKDESHS